jgi:hypothetical protein
MPPDTNHNKNQKQDDSGHTDESQSVPTLGLSAPLAKTGIIHGAMTVIFDLENYQRKKKTF